MSREVKICELCGALNDPSNEECCNTDCLEDLSYVPITEVEDEDTKEEESSSEVPEVCEKKEVKPSEVPETKPVINKTMVYCQNSLVNRIDGKEIEIPCDGCTLGRGGDIELEYFNQFQYVSTMHAALDYEGDDLTIRDLGSTNGTRVNNEKLVQGIVRVLKPGDVIKLANIQFVVE